mgnify:CR=1 FL=1
MTGLDFLVIFFAFVLAGIVLSSLLPSLMENFVEWYVRRKK